MLYNQVHEQYVFSSLNRNSTNIISPIRFHREMPVDLPRSIGSIENAGERNKRLYVSPLWLIANGLVLISSCVLQEYFLLVPQDSSRAMEG